MPNEKKTCGAPWANLFACAEERLHGHARTPTVPAHATHLSRRVFLGATASAIAAPMIVPATALGGEGSKAPSERINVGVIGLGSRGGQHLKAFLGRSDAQVLAVCDPYLNKQSIWKGYIERHYGKSIPGYKGCHVYTDFRELIARDDIDAVAIASPENWHALQGVTAVRAGKDVYGEKALTLTVEEGRTLVDAVRKSKRIFQVGTQQRSDQRFRHACELARNGYLGKLHTIKVAVPGNKPIGILPEAPVPPNLDYDTWLGPAPQKPHRKGLCTFNWYFVSDYCAGWIQSWGIHHCDIALWGAPQLMASTIDIEGTAEFPVNSTADTSLSWLVNMQTPDGLKVSFANDKRPNHPHGCRFIGDKGWVHVKRGSIHAEPKSLLTVKLKDTDEHLYESRNHHTNFLECIRSRRDPAAPVEAGHAATTMTLVADIATRLRRKLTWDGKAERFVNDDTANQMLGRTYRKPWQL